MPIPAHGWNFRLRCWLGSVDVGFQPDPSRRHIQKTQGRVLVVAGGHAAPTDAPFHGVARRVPFRSMGLGFMRRHRAGMTALMSRCACQARQASQSWPSPRSGRTGARRSKLLPRTGSRGCRGAGYPSRTGAGDGPGDPPGCESECRSRPSYGPERAPSLCSWARPTVLSRRTADRSGSACRRGQTS